MELSQGQIIKKPNKQELSSLFMTHCLNVMHAPVKFHKYIPYGLGVMAPTRFTIYGTKSRADNSKTKQARVVFLVHDTSSQCHACTCKFHKYIPYGLGVMASTRFTIYGT